MRVCVHVETQLPSLESGRVDHEDLPRLYQGMMMTRALLDHAGTLTARQQQVVQLYYRENLQQQQIALQLGISQQAVGDSLSRARTAIGRRLKQSPAC